MWDRFIKVNPEYKTAIYTSWYFCNTEKCSNELAELVVKGIKRGTASLHMWYESGKEKLPETGAFNVITNWDGIAQCITQTKKLTILPFKDVTPEMAETEGEGDKSLDYWRKAHIHFFNSELENENVEFNEDMNIVFEEFEMIFK